MLLWFDNYIGPLLASYSYRRNDPFVTQCYLGGLYPPEKTIALGCPHQSETFSVRNFFSPKRFQSETSSVRSANFLYRGFVSPKMNFVFVSPKNHFASPKIKTCFQCETSSVRKVISPKVVSPNLKSTSSIQI